MENWLYQETSGDQGIIYEEKSGRTIAVCYESKDMDKIAATPDLLLACEKALKFFDIATSEDYAFGKDKYLRRRLQNAVKKAKGE